MLFRSTRICVIVDYQGGDEQLGKDLAMHIAATAPVCVDADQLPEELVAKEKAIFLAQAKESGKPDDIAEKMVVGKLNKFMAENTLVGQPFVKEPDQKISALLKAKSAKVLSFLRLEVGEGIEKKSENFAEEVMAQIQE